MKKDKDNYNKTSSKGFYSMPNETTNLTTSTLASTTVNSFVPKVEQKQPSTSSFKKQESPKKSVTNVDKLTTLINAFENGLKDNKPTITFWINICNYLNKTNDPKVFEKFYIWFATHLKDYTSADVALLGVHTIQNANTKTRVGSTHQCFEELERALSTRNSHYRFTMKTMQIMGISEQLAQWFIRKSTR